MFLLINSTVKCKQNKLKLPIYSDSRNAIGWVRDKEARTNHNRSDKNNELFDLIDRAIKWLKENTYENEILKWETKAWGENPADFGRK
jgi:ribonuclease HI